MIPLWTTAHRCSGVEYLTALLYCRFNRVIQFISDILKYIPMSKTTARLHFDNPFRYILDILCAYLKHYNTY